MTFANKSHANGAVLCDVEDGSLMMLEFIRDVYYSALTSLGDVQVVFRKSGIHP